MLKKGHDDIAREMIVEGIRGAEKAIDEFLNESLKQTSALAKAIQSKK